MENRAWQRTREQLSYSRRSPETGELYRIIYTYREEFEYRYSELFEDTYGALRPEVLESFDAFLDCGILRHGCALACCEQCSHFSLIAFSCKKKICPSCMAKRACIVAEHLHENILLPYPHVHQVYTIPKRLRFYLKFKHKLNKYLYWAAWEAWQSYVSSRLPMGKAGAVMSMHSSGSMLSFHPHLHSLTLLGVVDGGGKFCKLSQPVDSVELEALFSEKLMAYLLGQEVISEELVENMKSWAHSGFSVFSGEAIESQDAEQRLFVGRYLMKSPISSSSIEVVENGLVPVVRCKKRLADGEQVREFSPLEFLAKLSLLVPRKWEQGNRYYGMYSSRARGDERKREGELEEKGKKESTELVEDTGSNDEPRRRPSSLWQACIKRVYELDPLVCPKCGGSMSIKSFVHDSKEIRRLCQKLGIQDWRAPPVINCAKAKEPYVDYSYAQ